MAPLAISSYNAGEGAVDRWLRERGELELDEFMETIPYDETRNYTKRVLSSFLTYAWLYDANRPVPELRFSLKPPRAERVGRPARRRNPPSPDLALAKRKHAPDSAPERCRIDPVWRRLSPYGVARLGSTRFL